MLGTKIVLNEEKKNFFALQNERSDPKGHF